MADDNQGVKPETEVEADAETTEEVKPTEDSSVEEEKDTQSKSSTDEKPAAETDEVEADESPVIEPKPVDGESPRERALRKEIEHLRGERREKRTQEFFGKSESTVSDAPRSPEQIKGSSKLKELESKFKPDELQNFREALEAAAEDLGFVRKDELTRQTSKDQAALAMDSFIEKHPEYLQENDKDDVMWNQFQREFNEYYVVQGVDGKKVLPDPKKLPKIFDRIHKSIVGDKPHESKEQIAARTQKVKVASHSTSQTDKKTGEGLHRSGGKLDPSLRGYLKGDFSDLDL